MKKIQMTTAATLFAFGMASAALAQHSNHAGHGAVAPSGTIPTERGDATFAAISEIVQILQQDPKTDWSRVNIDALRTHLVDMSILVSDARVETETIANGIVMQVSRSGRAGDAASRMVPAHGPVLAVETGWDSEVQVGDDVITWAVTAPTAAQVQQIKALGFFGLIATGDHHRVHHIALARGTPSH